MAKYKKGDVLRSRRTGVKRTVVGFTTKPDGLRRVRLASPTGDETRILPDNIGQNYKFA